MKKTTGILLLILLLGLSNSNQTLARTMGGSLSYSHISHDTFLIKVTLYRDCAASQLGNVNIDVKCVTSGSIITSISIRRPSALDITPVCPSSCTRCQTSGCSFPYGIEKYEYIDVVNLAGAGSCCEIEFIQTGNFRSGNITTGGAGTPFYLNAKLNRCLAPENNSPVSTFDPIKIICIAVDYISDLGIYDSDLDSNGFKADSLSFAWTQPMTSAIGVTNWTGQYTYDDPIFFWGFPNAILPFPRGFHLDKNRGIIMYRPMRVEQTIMVIKVEEWRLINGQRTLIGQSKHEIGIIVMTCPPGSLPSSSSNTTYVCEGDTLFFTINTRDGDTTDTLTISWNQSISDAVWSDNNGQVRNPTGVLTWVPGPEHVRSTPYQFIVTVADNTCPLPHRHYKVYSFHVRPKPQAAYTITDSICAIHSFNATVLQGVKPSFLWQGHFNPGFTIPGDSIHYQFNGPGKYPVSLTISEFGCSRTYFDTLEVDTFLTSMLQRNHSICVGDNLRLQAAYLYEKGHVTYKWDNGDTNYFIEFTGIKDITYSVDISDASGCTVTATAIVNVHKPPKLNLGKDKYICGSDSTMLYATMVFDRSTLKDIYWYKDSVLLHSGINPISVKDSGSYICLVRDTLRCTSEARVNVFMNPELKAYAPAITICKRQAADLEATETGSKTDNVKYFWYDTDSGVLLGTTRKLRLFPDKSKDYKLLVKETTGGTECEDSAMVRVNVNELPQITWDNIPESCIDGAWLTLSDYVLIEPQNSTRQWSSPSAGLLPIPPGDKFVPLQAGAGNHKIILTATNPANGCINKDSNIVRVHPLPTVNAGPDATICSGDGLFELSGLPVIPKGEWKSKTGIGVDKISDTYFFNPTAPGVSDNSLHTLIYTYTDTNGCTNSDSMDMRVYFTPSVNAGSDMEVCLNHEVVTLSGTPHGGIWSGNGLEQGNRFNPGLAGRGTHALVYAYTNVVCPAYDTLLIHVLNSPEVYLFTDDHRTSFCTGFGLVPVYSYPPNGLLTGPFSHSNLFNADTTEGKYTFNYTYTDSFGCTFLQSLELETGTPYMTINKKDSVFCKGDTMIISLIKRNTEKIMWSVSKDADGSLVGDAYQNILNYIPGQKDLTRKQVKIYLSSLDTLCIVPMDSFIIRLADIPEVHFYAESPYYDINVGYFTVKFHDQSIVYNSPANYLWDFGNQSTSILQNPVATYYDTGYYSVSLSVSDFYKCVSKHTKTNYIHLTGIQEFSETNRIIIYPNPANTHLYIKSNFIIKEIRLINSLGKLVWHECDLNTREYQLDAFPKGLYLIEIMDINGIRTWNKVMFN